MARVGLALVAVQRGDAASAAEQYAALAPVPGIMVFYIGTDQVLGLLSVTLGRLDQAVGHFEDSLEFCRSAGYGPNLAWTCYDYAGALAQRNGPGDREKMIVLLDAWLEVQNWRGADTPAGAYSANYNLALGKDPLNTAQLIPVGRISEHLLDVGVGATDQPLAGTASIVEQLFKAHGTMWAAKEIAIDIIIPNQLGVGDADLHLDWTVAEVDWWVWFVSWNNLEASPDGNLVDGQRFYD